MLRMSKKVQLMEWGEGTNTTNQIWTVFCEGSLAGKPKRDGLHLVLTVESSGTVDKKNEKDDAVKVMQQGEGMTPRESKSWGEVAYGRLKSIGKRDGKTIVEVELKNAAKFGN